MMTSRLRLHAPEVDDAVPFREPWRTTFPTVLNTFADNTPCVALYQAAPIDPVVAEPRAPKQHMPKDSWLRPGLWGCATPLA